MINANLEIKRRAPDKVGAYSARISFIVPLFLRGIKR
jgi:hypothetical protein